MSPCIELFSISVKIIAINTFILLSFGIFIKFPNVFSKWASSQAADYISGEKLHAVLAQLRPNVRQFNYVSCTLCFKCFSHYLHILWTY